MGNKNFNNLEDEIKYIIQNAINSKDFYQLNKDIQNTVNGALNEAKSALGLKPKQNRFNEGQGFDNSSNFGQNPYGQNSNNQNSYEQNSYGQNSYGQYNYDQTNHSAKQNQNNKEHKQYDYYQDRAWNRREERAAYYREKAKRRKENAKQRHQRAYEKTSPWNSQPYTVEKYPSEPIGKVAGILYTVFGSILQTLSGLAIIILLIIGELTPLFTQLTTVALWIVPAFVIGTALSIRGSSLRKRIRRFNRYKALFHDRAVYNIKDLSTQLEQKPKAITRELRKMIQIGMFPEGHIDANNTCIMLNQESFRQYQDLQNRLKEQAKMQETSKQSFQTKDVNSNETKTTNTSNTDNANAKNTDSNEKTVEENAMNESLAQAISSGKACILQIRAINDALPEVEISDKLDRLETVIDKIFAHVATHPEQLSEIKKFMDYYLPTTLKLVLAYQEFENQPIQGDNITTAKREIMDTLDTINRAFETLLDSLFEDAAMDVSTDISVLKTMLAQEGLTEGAFNTKQPSGGKKNEQ